MILQMALRSSLFAGRISMPDFYRSRARRATARSNPFERDRDPLPDADAHRRQRISSAGLVKLERRRAGDAGARHAQRMAERDRAAIAVDPLIVIGNAERAQHRQPLAGKGLVEFDDVELFLAHAEPGHQLARGRNRTDAHDAWRNGGGGAAEDAGDRRQAVFSRRRFGSDDHRSGAIIDAGGITCGHRAAFLFERGAEFRQRLDRRRARMLVPFDDDGIALALRNGHRGDLLRQPSIRLRGRRLRLAAHGKGILVRAADMIVLGDILACFRHGIDAVLLLHHRIDETPADRRVVNFGRPRKGRLGLRHDEGRARHALDAARNHQLGLAGADGARRGDHRIHAGAAEPVDRRARDNDRQAGQERRHARHIAVVLARLVGAAEDHVVDGVPVDDAIALHQRLQRDGAEIVGAHRGERAGEAADRRPDIVADKGFGHGFPFRASER
ncbi:hypothetical protein RHECNPAF_1260041 [Rhizobium etli CNPAF512]|nr:hypothetical protein RHECNPAF_1260041 [Rhizobium etli CNPAF512]